MSVPLFLWDSESPERISHEYFSNSAVQHGRKTADSSTGWQAGAQPAATRPLEMFADMRLLADDGDFGRGDFEAN